MARFVPNNDVTRILTQGVPDGTTEDLVSIGSKVMRFKIIADRYTRGFEKAQRRGPKDAYMNSGLPIFATEKRERELKIREGRFGRAQEDINPQGAYTSQPFSPINLDTTSIDRRVLNDSISIVDLDADPIMSLGGEKLYRSITLPFVPREVSYEPSSKFIGIATMGRNNPHYHFTGSEDTIKFDIDWFTNDPSRKDVILACRWIEGLSKANGYEEPPHRVKLVWGEDDLLFKDEIWIVVDAPYLLSDFNKGYRDKDTREIIRTGLLPSQAIQKITLKRVTSDNRTTNDIFGTAWPQQ